MTTGAAEPRSLSAKACGLTLQKHQSTSGNQQNSRPFSESLSIYAYTRVKDLQLDVAFKLMLAGFAVQQHICT